MGHGYWTRESFTEYSVRNGRKVDARGHLDASLSDAQLFVQRSLHPNLNPQNVMRECCDTAEHPQSVPVILALDVTGSMGAAAAEVARKLNEVMTLLYTKVKDVEFMVMGIGDLAYDNVPIQISQFESDIRIAEQLDQIYLEHGGGGNAYESYTAAWYMGVHHTRLDCWKRGRKGLIITMGDEPMNPYLPFKPLACATGDQLTANVDTPQLYQLTAEKFEVYHLHVNHTVSDRHWAGASSSFGNQLPAGHLRRVSVDTIAQEIVNIVTQHAQNAAAENSAPGETAATDKGILKKLISW
ncbi:MAG: hypothetical protein IJ041_01450 [Clostridia bacterium]|nr:hypothetical protein [Clostridia bacterium]